jgi:hypothetical protein
MEEFKLGVFTLLGDTLKQLFKEDPILLASLIVGLVLLIWVFKETQNYIKSKDDKDGALLEKKLIAYGQLRTYLTIFLESHNQEDKVQVLNHLGNYVPYLSYSFFQRCYLFLEDPENIQEIKEYLSEVDDEIKTLKLRYDSLCPDEDRTKVFGTISSYFQLAEHIGKPFYLTGITILLIITFILISSLLNKGDYAGFFNGISILLLLLLGMGSLSLVLDKKFKHSRKNWAILLGLFIISLIFIYSYKWYLGLVNIIAIFTYLFFFAPVLKKKVIKNTVSK